MKKLILLFIIQYISQTALVAQAPSWHVNESAYQYTMTFVAKLNVDGKPLVNKDDQVAAFVGTTCRGASGITYVASKNTYYAYLTVFSNTQDEAIYFKLYDSATDKITTVSKQIMFKVNEHRGNLFQSYSIAEPALNTKSELLTFHFKDVKNVSSNIANRSVNIVLYDSVDITNLNPEFTLSSGGKLLKKREQKQSGAFIDNFTNVVTYEILSEDESSLSSYNVTLTQIKTPTLFYKKDAVCYAGGVIKVVSNQEGANVKLTSDGITISTKKITNGEALFTNLEPDSYIVSLGEELKLINILLKTK